MQGSHHPPIFSGVSNIALLADHPRAVKRSCDSLRFLNTLMPLDPRQIEVMDDAMADVYRNKTSAERLRIANDLWKSAQRMFRAQVQAAHPEWDEAQIVRETARRISNGSVV